MNRIEPLFRRLAPLLVLCVILIEAGISLGEDARNGWLPSPTHHHQYLTVKRLVREIEGWTPVDPNCAPANCNAGFELPADQVPATSFVASTRWLWDHGDKYPNRSPLHGLPSAILAVLFPGSAAVVALGLRFWFALLLWGVYRLGCMASGPLAGLTAVVLTAGTPAVFGTGRVHADTAALVPLGVWLVVAILASDGFLRLRWALLSALLTLALFRCSENAANMFGIWAGLIAPAAAATFAAVNGFRTDRRWRRVAGFAIISALPSLLCIHYLRNESTKSYIANTVTESHADWFGRDSLTQLPLLAYPEEFVRNLIRFPLLAFVLLGIVMLLRTPNRYRWVLLGSFVVPVAVVMCIARLAGWYVIPAIPVLMCAAAVGLAAIRTPWLRIAVTAAAVATGAWMRISMAVAPRAIMVAAMANFPNNPALKWLDFAIGPVTVMSGEPLQAPVSQVEGAAAMDIASVARMIEESNSPAGHVTRVLVISDTQHREFATCWVVKMQSPRSTCFAGTSGWYDSVPNALWNPERYDLVAWVSRRGLRDLVLSPSAELPAEILASLDRINPAEQSGPRALLQGLRELRWASVAVPGGTVYRRVRP